MVRERKRGESEEIEKEEGERGETREREIVRGERSIILNLDENYKDGRKLSIHAGRP